MSTVKLTVSEKESKKMIEINPETPVDISTCSFYTREVSTETFVYKKLISTKGLLTDEVEEGRFEIKAEKLVKLISESIANNELYASATNEIYELVLALAQIDNVVDYNEAKILMAQKYFTRLDIVKYIFKTLLSGRNQKDEKNILKERATKQVFAFSTYSVEDEELSGLLRRIFGFAVTLQEEILKYDTFISFRPADMIVMSYGISDSCYGAGGLFSHAPYVVSSIQNTFVCYSNSKDTDANVLPMRRGRFFGFSYDDFAVEGRLYRKMSVKFLYHLLMLVHVDGRSKISNEKQSASTYNVNVDNQVDKILSAFNHRLCLDSLLPGDGFTYVDDLCSRSVSVTLESLSGIAAIEQAKNLLITTQTENRGIYRCPTCHSEFDCKEDYLDIEYTLSCCEGGHLVCCNECGGADREDEMYYVEGEDNWVCQDCYQKNSKYFSCAKCDTVSYSDDSSEFLNQCDQPVCEVCACNYMQYNERTERYE